jgi:hypothetical protein
MPTAFVQPANESATSGDQANLVQTVAAAAAAATKGLCEDFQRRRYLLRRCLYTAGRMTPADKDRLLCWCVYRTVKRRHLA